jgi:hypothetical protein
MKTRVTVIVLSAALAWCGTAAAQPLGTAFTYQGRLTDAGNPASGAYDFQFVLLDAAAGGTQVGPTLTRDDVDVSSGLFTVSLDFGSVFGGARRWISVATRPGASTGAYTPLLPLQELTGAPHAAFSLAVPWTGIANKPAGFADDVDNDSGGDITSVTAGTALTGGGTAGAVTLDVALGGGGSATTVARSDHDHFAQSWTSAVSGPGLSVANTTATQNGADNVSGVRGTGVYGVLGETASTTGRGVVGRNASASGVGYGVFGQSGSTTGRGVYGLASAFSGVNYGVYGETNSTAGYAGYFAGRVGISAGTAPLGDLQIGDANDVTAFRFGNLGARHHLISNRDMVFNAWDIDGVPLGTPLFLWRKSTTIFQENGAMTLMTLGETGNLTVTGNASILGTLSKGAGSFKIDHPLDPENKYLYHSFVESPDMMNVYNGNVTTDADGYATVELPEWFEALNRDFRYQLTVIDDGEGWALAKVVREVRENRFVLRTSVPRTRVSWQVTGIRHDAFAEQHRIPVEEDKAADARGRYLHPVEHGQPAEKRIAIE